MTKARAWSWVVFACVLWACGGDDAPPDDGGHDGASECSADSTCDDGQFCNGLERCSGGACVAGAPACGEMACDEALDECVSCDEPDADGDGAASIACGGDDCDDTDPDISPDATEICDAEGVDEDCDPSTLGERDIDGDGRTSSVCCNGDTCGLDCDDSNAATYSGATEVCNGFDDDCDGSVDEGVQAMLWVDADRDGAGDPAMRVAACADTPGFVNNDDDCDDTNPTANPAGIEACDEVDNDCDGNVDENAVAIAWYLDADGDGFGVSTGEPVISCTPVAGHAPVPGDCDDTARDVNPLAAERCNARDDNCDGRADYRIGPGNFEDDDGDGFADAMCPGGAGNDCDDRDGTVHPGAPELCDFRDNDCDGTVDGVTTMSRWYVDADGDGWGDDTQPFLESCEPQAGRAFRAGDCDDTNASIRPGVVDGCDGIDQDCDGERDENSPRLAYYNDGDGDGWGAGAVTFACVPPMDATTRVGDCADDDDTRYPSAPEDCNVRDDDCDGRIDEGAALRTFYQDADRDGYGRAGGTTREACVAPVGFADNTDDCDDGNPSRNPGATELCNNVDDDCDMVVDGAAANAACTVANGTGICRSGGTCDIASCSAPFDDCDAVIANGCETDTRSTAEHCGGCGMACGAADTCAASTCADSPIVQVATNVFTSCARRENGRVACWSAANAFGQLGDGAPLVGGEFRASSTPVAVLGIDDAVDVAVAWGTACAVRASGEVWCWGNDSNGLLGRGAGVPIAARSTPAPVVGVSDAVQVATTGNGTCARRSSGRVVCWGDLGNDTAGSSVPTPVTGLIDAVDIDPGHGGAMCALRSGGSVVCWGFLYEATPTTPAWLASLTGGVELARASGTICIRRADRSIACAVHFGDSLAPSPTVTDVVQLVGGQGHFCARRSDGSVSCWGDNGFGQLGRGTTGAITLTPAVVFVPTSSGVSAGGVGTCVATQSGLAYCWGRNNEGEVDLTREVRPSPVLVPGL